MVYYYIYEHSIYPGPHRLRRNAGAGHRLKRGHELFTSTQQPDGTDVLHAYCEIDDEPMVARDVVAPLDHTRSAPRDAYVRLSVDHRFEGSGWFRFTWDYVEAARVRRAGAGKYGARPNGGRRRRSPPPCLEVADS